METKVKKQRIQETAQTSTQPTVAPHLLFPRTDKPVAEILRFNERKEDDVITPTTIATNNHCDQPALNPLNNNYKAILFHLSALTQDDQLSRIVQQSWCDTWYILLSQQLVTIPFETLLTLVQTACQSYDAVCFVDDQLVELIGAELVQLLVAGGWSVSSEQCSHSVNVVFCGFFG